ncbi:unnamed protein product, partial [Rotaria socialis]
SSDSDDDTPVKKQAVSKVNTPTVKKLAVSTPVVASNIKKKDSSSDSDSSDDNKKKSQAPMKT